MTSVRPRPRASASARLLLLLLRTLAGPRPARRYLDAPLGRALIRRCWRFLLAAADAARPAEEPPVRPATVRLADLPQPPGYDAATREWAHAVLEGRALFPAVDPDDRVEGLADVLRLRGVATLLAELYAATGSPAVYQRLGELAAALPRLAEREPAAAWDTTNAALRLVSLAQAAQVLQASGRRLPGWDAGLEGFVRGHERFLALGAWAEPHGNHLAVNAAGRAALHVLLTPEPLPGPFLDTLRDAFDAQFLPDGGHVERSPHYHLQVLSLLSAVRGWDQARPGRAAPELERLEAGGRGVLARLMAPDAQPLRFGDVSRSWLGRTAASLAAPFLAAAPCRAEAGASLLADFGVASFSWVARSVVFDVFVDVGPLGYALNPGHGHADMLSFCLYAGGRPVIVDPGTYRYSASPEHRWFKLADAHSTVYFPGSPATRLAGFYRWRDCPGSPPMHLRHSRRRWRLEAEQGWQAGGHGFRHGRRWRAGPRGLALDDIVRTDDAGDAVARLPLAPGTAVHAVGPRELVLTGDHPSLRLRFRGTPAPQPRVVPAPYAPAYGELRPSLAVEWVLPPGGRSRALSLELEVA